MKFVIGVDLEGIAMAYAPDGGSIEEAFNIEYVRDQASREADAAAKALFDMGATRVVIWDNHGRGCSLNPDLIDERCDIALGGANDRNRYPVLDSSYAGVLFVGYHTMASNGKGAISHTYSSTTFQSIKLNGREVGEIAVDGAIAGAIGVPVIYVSGDNHLVAEAHSFLPWAGTTVTKESFSFSRILSKHPKRVCKEIYEDVKKSVARLDEMKLFTIKTPVEMEIRYRRLDAAMNTKVIDMNGDPFTYVDDYTRKGMLKSMEDVVRRL